LRKPSFSATSAVVKDRTSVVTSYCRDGANASNLDQGGNVNGCALFLAFELQFAGSSRQAKGKDVLVIDDTAQSVLKGVPSTDLKGLVRVARHFSRNFQCNKFGVIERLFLSDDIEVVEVILALIVCHTIVKHLKNDVYDYELCVRTTFRAAHLSDVAPSQSIFIQTS
jgi:hypothetical protein